MAYYRVLAAARRDLNPNSSSHTLSKDLLLGMIFGDYPQPETRINWARMGRLAQRWIPATRIMHPYPEQRFAASHP